MEIIAWSYKAAASVMKRHNTVQLAFNDCIKKARTKTPHGFWDRVDSTGFTEEAQGLAVVCEEQLDRVAGKGRVELVWAGVHDVGTGFDLRAVRKWSGSLTNDGWMFQDHLIGESLLSPCMERLYSEASKITPVRDQVKNPQYMVDLFIPLVYFGMILKTAMTSSKKKTARAVGIGLPDYERIFLI